MTNDTPRMTPDEVRAMFRETLREEREAEAKDQEQRDYAIEERKRWAVECACRVLSPVSSSQVSALMVTQYADQFLDYISKRD